ncbi:MAG: tyrosine protein phosphatase [Nitrospirae bacterium]|nr:tyrosine protein phosphatase [Nitrospirota bacterium]
MIDIHNHILPGIDDGASSPEKSLQMARIAVNDGIRVVVATPHVNNGVYEVSAERIVEEVDRLNLMLRQEDIPLRVLPGADIHVDFKLVDAVKNGEVMTVNNNRRYIMLELPEYGVPQHMSDFLWELKINGITPVFTHPERNAAIQDDINILQGFIMQGALSQITAMSLTGEFGRRPRKCAAALLKYNLAHVIATDAHSARRRPPVLSGALRVAGDIVGDDFALRMVTEIPENIINGVQVSIPEPKSRKTRFFERLLSRN